MEMDGSNKVLAISIINTMSRAFPCNMFIRRNFVNVLATLVTDFPES